MSSAVAALEKIHLRFLETDCSDRFDLTYGLPAEFTSKQDQKKVLLPADHPFSAHVMGLITSDTFQRVLDKLTDRFAAENRFAKPNQIYFGTLDTGERADS